MLEIELIYIREDNSQFQRHFTLKDGATVSDALSASDIYLHCPEAIDFRLGIFSRPVDKTTKLQNGDRVEIYRPLKINPMEKRRLRAKIQKKLRDSL